MVNQRSKFLREKLSYLSELLAVIPANSMRVLTYHDIGPQEFESFKQQIIFAAQHYRFITMAEFEAMHTGKQPIKGRNLLLTFDDGFKSNRTVVEEILNPLGIKACFFVLPDFIDVVDKQRFIAEQLYEYNAEHRTSMSWQDLAYLLQHGHTIGSHSRSHPYLTKVIHEQQLAEEIIGSANIIQNKLGIAVQHFAYPFGKVDFISTPALQLAKQHYQYVFSGVRGTNNKNTLALAIRREEVNPGYSLQYYNLILNGGLAPRYYFNRRKLDKMAMAAA